MIRRYCKQVDSPRDSAQNDVRRHDRLRTGIALLVQRRTCLSTANEPSERQSIYIDVQGRLGNDRGALAWAWAW